MIEHALKVGIKKILSDAGMPVPVYISEGVPNVQKPYIVVTIISDIPKLYFDTPDDYDIKVQVDIFTEYGQGPEYAQTIAALVNTALHRKTHTVEGITSCQSWSIYRSDVRREEHMTNRIIHQYRFVGTE